MLKDKQMSIVVYYYLETGKSRNIIGIQISKKIFSYHHYIIIHQMLCNVWKEKTLCYNLPIMYLWSINVK